MEWPWQYSFPPFFTLQPHRPTREKQVQAWKHLVITYCQTNCLSTLDLAETGDLPLFFNSDIQRRLSQEEVREVCESLAASGNLEWTDKSKRRAYIFWKSPSQLGADIYRWVEESGQKGTVMTIAEILEEGSSSDTSWKGISHEIMLKSLVELEKSGKAEVFEGQDGVKFF